MCDAQPDFLYDVFLSYSPDDRTAVQMLADRLRANGLRVWYDQWEIKPGDDVFQVTADGRNASRIVLFAMSEAAFRSDGSRSEPGIALFPDPANRRRRFIPLLLEEVVLPAELARLKHIDWRDRSEETLQIVVESCLPRRTQSSARRRTRKTPVKRQPARVQGSRFPQPGATFEMEWYVHRYVEEEDALSALASSNTPLFLWAPKDYGKTWFLCYVVSQAKNRAEPPWRVVWLDLDAFPASTLNSLSEFARAFMTHAAEAMNIAPRQVIIPAFLESEALITTRRFLRELLNQADNPLILVLDSAERLLGKGYEQDLFGLLRSCIERAEELPWSRLRLVMGVSTSPDNFAREVLSSPLLNVAWKTTLKGFTLEQVHDLARCYGLNCAEAQLRRLLNLTGGHPLLTQLPMRRAVLEDRDLNAFLDSQNLDSSVFGSYLAERRTFLLRHPDLAEGMKTVLANRAVRLPLDVEQRLRIAGFLERSAAGYTIPCRLYELYLTQYLP